MMNNPNISDCPAEEEAFFINYAQKLRLAVPNMIVMLTGGFKSVDAMNWAISNNFIDIIGLARPFCMEPNLPKKLIGKEISSVPRYRLAFGPAFLSPIVGPTLNNFWHQYQN